MMSQHPLRHYDIPSYHKILCPVSDYPDFLNKYIELPVLQRLKGVGLLCGTDWTKLYNNRLYYSRLDHSIGVALIVWHFTHNKAQTIAGLLHDISTPVFSHVSDFRKGDALTQTVTEGPTASIIRNDKKLQELLTQDDLTSQQVEDYHIYPIADNEIPRLSADRLEYMFPSGMALDGSWTMDEIIRCYNDIDIFQNEDGLDELGFKTLKIAEEYCYHFCMIGHILQLNENKLTLQMLGQVMNKAVENQILSEDDFMSHSEAEIIFSIDKWINNKKIEAATEKEIDFIKLYKTFRTMTTIKHTDKAPDDNHFCVNLKVKQRYINPLVIDSNGKPVRLSTISEYGNKIIKDFQSYTDTPYGAVELMHIANTPKFW